MPRSPPARRRSSSGGAARRTSGSSATCSTTPITGRSGRPTRAGFVALYVKAWGRRGDTAVIALDKGFPVGAAWYRLFDRGRPGFGFVDERTPELAIAVVPNARGKGVGTALLKALLERARADSYPTVSLSVDRANAGAIELYDRHGFEQVAEDDDSVTMLAHLE